MIWLIQRLSVGQSKMRSLLCAVLFAFCAATVLATSEIPQRGAHQLKLEPSHKLAGRFFQGVLWKYNSPLDYFIDVDASLLVEIFCGTKN
jgi:hypothetical protein